MGFLFSSRMSSIQTGRRPNQGNVTLESLLDSPGLTPSPLSDFINGADGEAVAASSVNGSQIPASAQMMTSADRGRDDVGATNQPSEVVRISETQRRAFLRDICSELLCVLRMQDVNGYFLSVPCPRSLKVYSIVLPLHSHVGILLSQYL